MGVLAVVVGLSLGACSDDSDSSSGDGPKSPSTSDIGSPADDPADDPSVTEVTVDCPEFEDAAKKIADAQTALYDPAGNTDEAIDDLLAELDALKKGAPDDVQQALTDLSSGFQDAADLLENPTQGNQARLVALASQLADDGRQVTDYIQEQCS
jgi:uncharacterized phage infection (PIP) family protein YhgE